MSRILRVVIFPIVALFVTSQILSAQAPKTEKRIYLLDLTGSMEGRGSVHTPNILQTVKDNLAATIENIDDPNTEIVIIPFTNVPHNAIEGVASIKDSLITQIQKLGVRSGDTNIADAWSEGIKNLDNSKINYLFLLTDGLHNTGPSKQVLFERLRKWGETAPGNNEYAFYVMLTPNAKETEICEIVDSTSQMWLIESMDINASLIRTAMNQRKNVFSNPSTSISFFSNNRNTRFEDLGLQVSFEENDFYYVDNLKKSVVGDIYTFDIIEKLPKIQMPLDTTLTLRLSYDKEKNPFVYLTPEVISFQVINQGPRILTVSVQNSKKGLKDLNLRKLKYKEPFQGYFRWTRKFYEPTFGLAFMSRPDTASTSTNFILNWNEEAVRAGASVKFNLITSENDFGDHIKVSNGKDDIAFVARAESDTLCLKTTVIPGIPSTRFAGDIVALTNNIDTINDTELNIDEAVIGNWRLQYKKSWPFWIWLFWLLLTATAVALVYFIVRYCIKGIASIIRSICAWWKKPRYKQKRMRKASNKQQKPQKEGNDEEDDGNIDKKPLDERIKLLVKAYIYSPTISSGCCYLLKLLYAMDDLKEIDSEENERVFSKLPKEVQTDLDKLNSAFILPKSQGHWESPAKRGDCMWIPDDNRIPPNSSYSNVFGKSWRQIKDQYHIEGIVYNRGIPDFSPILYDSVTFDWEQELGQAKMCKLLAKKEHKDLHEAAFAIMAKKRGISVAELKQIKEKSGANLLWHEDINGKTVHLIAQEVHGNLRHIGGIAISQIVGVSPARVYRHFSADDFGHVSYIL